MSAETPSLPRPASGPGTKAAWRQLLAERRRALSPQDRQQGRSANATHLLDLLSDRGGTVCAFRPLRSEPLDPALLDNLHRLGVRVLVPVTVGAAPLDWAVYLPGSSVGAMSAPHRGPTLGPDALRQAHTVLVPGYAADSRGYRLGRGGGHYDRTLARRVPDQLRIATVFDHEFTVALPIDELDQPVTHVVRPRAGVLAVPRSA